MTNLKTYLLALMLLLLCSNLFSQKAPIKFGKINIEDLKMEYYELDSGAPAVVLCDYGRSYFVYTEEKGFQMKFERIKRIKILTKEGYEYANFEIPLYERNFVEESVGIIKGITYNLEEGKITKNKLKLSDVYKEQESKNWKNVKFSMPNVSVGSVIEIRYTIVSDFWFNLKDWYFQQNIPVKWSEYRVTIPEFYTYKLQIKGYETLAIFDNYKKTEKFSFHYSSKIADVNKPGGGSRSSAGTASFESISEYYRFVAKNVKSFKTEPYITTVENYITKIEFELASVKFPNSTLKNYTTTWEKINKELILAENFGLRMKRSRFIDDLVVELIDSVKDKNERMSTIHSYVINNIKWNGIYSKYAFDHLREVYKNKSGNVAEVNFLLIAMLRKSGIKADPVLLSTRSHGFIFPGRPMISAFNYVIAMAEVNGEKYFIDATDPNCPINVLPKRCLNDKGRLISPGNSQWVEINANGSYKKVSVIDLELDENFDLIGEYNNVRYEYAALSFRNTIDNSKSEESYIEDKEKNNPGLNILEYEIINLDTISKPVEDKYKIKLSDRAVTAGNLVYFNPIIFNSITENPFKLEERQFPVDYAYPINETYICNFVIPEGYELEELPKPLKIALPEGNADFLYNATVIDNKIQITTRFRINKTIFVQNEYSSLKEFYNQVVSKQKEQIIIKKS